MKSLARLGDNELVRVNPAKMSSVVAGEPSDSVGEGLSAAVMCQG